jgi:hypothetical protein
MNRVIIGLTGRKQSGKTTAAAYLVERGFVRLSFAAPLKAMVATLLANGGLDTDEIIALMDDDKEQVIPGMNCSVRHLLQTLSTEWGRNCLDPGLWVDLMHKRLERCGDLIVIDDVRFEDEALLIRELGGVIIHIGRADLDAGTDTHASEAGIMNHYGDRFVDNDGALDDFLYEVGATCDWVLIHS